MKRYRTILVTAALGLLLLPACERENLLGTIRDSVSFAVTVEEGVATKAAPDVLPCTTVDDAGTESELFLTMESAPFPASISAAPATKDNVTEPRKNFENNPFLGLVAYAYSTGGAAPENGWVVKTSKLSPPQPEVILPGMIPLYQDTPGNGESLRPDGSSKWIPLHPDRLLWPGEGYVRYFAVAPYVFVRSTLTTMANTGIVEVVAQDGSAPKVNYTVPAPVEDQVDLLVSTPSSTKEYSGDPGWRKIDVPMQLAHAMTGIRFRLPEGVSIESLSITGLYGSGTLDLTSSPLAWSPTGSADASYSLSGLSLNTGLEADTEYHKTGYNVTNAYSIFYLLPQVLPSGAKITVTIKLDGSASGGVGRTITADIAGQEWRPGTMVTYTITKNMKAAVFSVSYNNGTPTSSDGSGTPADGGTITLADGKAVRLPFKVTTNMGYTVEVSDGSRVIGTLPVGSGTFDNKEVPVTLMANVADVGASNFTEAEFTVSATKKVKFSPGNLQYQASTNTWRFASHQWASVDLGVVVAENGEVCNNSLASENYPGWFDTFCFGNTGINYRTGRHYYQPWLRGDRTNDIVVEENGSQKTLESYYYGPGSESLSQEDWDWGVAHSIYWGTDLIPAGTYHMISQDEMKCIMGYTSSGGQGGIRYTNEPYRFMFATLPDGPERTLTITFTAEDDASYAVAYTVEQPGMSVDGAILFPDGFYANHSALASAYESAMNPTNSLSPRPTVTNWSALEAAGCVFLVSRNEFWLRDHSLSPTTAGLRTGNAYWVHPSDLYFSKDRRNLPMCVRLVKDVTP